MHHIKRRHPDHFHTGFHTFTQCFQVDAVSMVNGIKIITSLLNRISKWTLKFLCTTFFHKYFHFAKFQFLASLSFAIPPRPLDYVNSKVSQIHTLYKLSMLNYRATKDYNAMLKLQVIDHSWDDTNSSGHD